MSNELTNVADRASATRNYTDTTCYNYCSYNTARKISLPKRVLQIITRRKYLVAREE